VKRTFFTRQVFDGIDIFLTALCQLFVGFLDRLANPVSLNCNCGLILKNKNEKTSCFSMNCEFLVRREETNDKFLL